MLRWVRRLLLALEVGNGVAALFFLLVLGSLLLRLPPGSAKVASAALPGEAERLRGLLAVMMLIGLATGGAVALLFRRLVAILDTVAAGRPFSLPNARRLRHIAWALLAVQALDVAFGFLSAAIGRIVRQPPFTWSPSVTGWLAVLLLFVLAELFVRGAAMADELDATV